MSAALKDEWVINDPRGSGAFCGWGSRHVRAADARPATAVPYHLPGRINPRSLRTIPKFPAAVRDTEPVLRREPRRACGGHTFIKPYFEQYSYYRVYGNAGHAALSSHHHNFPVGDVPVPQHLYGDEPQCAAGALRRRPRSSRTVACGTTVSIPVERVKN